MIEQPQEDTTVPRAARAPEPGRIRIARLTGAVVGRSQRLEGLLQRRLLAAYLIVLFGVGGIAAFQLWCLWRGIPATPDAVEFVRLRNQKLCEAFLLAACAVYSAILWKRRQLTLRALRFIELSFVCLLSAYLSYMHFDWFAKVMPVLRAQDTNPLSLYWLYRMSSNSAALPWMAMMIGYATVIPNTGRRCALVLGILAPCPVALALAAGLWVAPMEPITLVAYLFDLSMWNGIGAAIGIAGAYRIEMLRCAAETARQLGQYILKERIGGGGMGEVFRADHALLRRPCAVKVIKPDRGDDPEALERFEREVQSTANLSHPNTIQIYDYGRADDGTFYYVMEYLPGRNLEQIVRESRPLRSECVRRIVLQLCGALREAHAIGLIHRDIKPHNVMLLERAGVQDFVKLFDFGLVKRNSARDETSALTLRGVIAGTPSYMSPEQAAGESGVDARSDIYSLGALAYFLLTGQPPFVRPTAVQTMAAHLSDPVVAPSQIASGVDPRLEQIILKALQKRPEDRYQCIGEMADSLENLNTTGAH